MPLLKEPLLWAELDFQGAKAGRLTNPALLRVCRRARGELRSLDVSDGKACRRIKMTSSGRRPFLNQLADEGLTAKLESVSCYCGSELTFGVSDAFTTLEAAKELMAASPRLRSIAGAEVYGPWEAAVEALTLLPLTKRTEVELWPSESTAQTFVAFATALADALSSSRPTALDTLTAGNAFDLSFITLFRRGAETDPAATEAAAIRLGNVLADPLRGPRVYQWSECDSNGWLPALAHMCRALTPASPLRDLRAAVRLTDDEVAALAEALSSGRSRLESLEISDTDLYDDDDDDDNSSSNDDGAGCALF